MGHRSNMIRLCIHYGIVTQTSTCKSLRTSLLVKLKKYDTNNENPAIALPAGFLGVPLEKVTHSTKCQSKCLSQVKKCIIAMRHLQQTRSKRLDLITKPMLGLQPDYVITIG